MLHVPCMKPFEVLESKWICVPTCHQFHQGACLDVDHTENVYSATE